MRYFTTRASFQRNSSLLTETTRNFFQKNIRTHVSHLFFGFQFTEWKPEIKELNPSFFRFKNGNRIIFPLYGIKTGNTFFCKECKKPGFLFYLRKENWKYTGLQNGRFLVFIFYGTIPKFHFIEQFTE